MTAITNETSFFTYSQSMVVPASPVRVSLFVTEMKIIGYSVSIQSLTNPLTRTPPPGAG